MTPFAWMLDVQQSGEMKNRDVKRRKTFVGVCAGGDTFRSPF